MQHNTIDEKISFIVKTELEILEAISKGHKCSDDDQFAESRKLILQYRIEMGLISEKNIF